MGWGGQRGAAVPPPAGPRLCHELGSSALCVPRLPSSSPVLSARPCRSCAGRFVADPRLQERAGGSASEPGRHRWGVPGGEEQQQAGSGAGRGPCCPLAAWVRTRGRSPAACRGVPAVPVHAGSAPRSPLLPFGRLFRTLLCKTQGFWKASRRARIPRGGICPRERRLTFPSLGCGNNTGGAPTSAQHAPGRAAPPLAPPGQRPPACSVLPGKA